MQGAASARTLRVLHIEDSEPDHALAATHLRRAGLQVHWQRIETLAALDHALDNSLDNAPDGALDHRPWDAVLCDHNLPGFTGLQALALLRARDAVLPFILLSGQIGEDAAVAAMRQGASDYLLKHNLARLAPALENAIAAGEAQRARQAADAALAVSRLRLSELAQHLQTSVEAERNAIAREIHDEVGGALTALKFELDWMRRHAQQDAVAQRAVAALDTVTQAIESSQRIMHNLRPAILEQGLVPALQWLAQGFERRTGIACVLHAPPDTGPLPGGVPLVAYRCAQEALTNVSKHAQAARVQIDLTLGAGVMLLEVSDDGCGLRSDDLAKARSFGIRGLRERAATVGGWVDISGAAAGGPQAAAGTTLILSVPLTEQGRLAAETTP